MSAGTPSTSGDGPWARVRALARREPDAPALVASGLVVSRRRLADAVAAMAGRLRDRGLAAGDSLGWLGLNSVEMLTALFACEHIGARFVPLNWRLAAAELAAIGEHAGLQQLHADEAMLPLADAVRAQLPLPRPHAGGHREGDLLLAYTSGTTGRPKGAVRSSAGNPEQLARMVEFIGYLPDDVYLTTGPLYHSGPGGFAAIAHLLGNTIVLQRRFDPEDWLRLVERYRVTTTFSAPTPIRLVCQLPDHVKRRYDRTSLARTIANAAPWSFALKEMYLRDFPEDSLFEVYGSTELGVDTILRPEDQRRKPGSCGRPAPGVELALFDESGRMIEEPHVPGELFVKSPSVFETYHNAPEKYEKGRRDDWLTVGDVAYRDEEGFYYICDRKNDMIISGGMNVYPAEIESALDRHPRVLDVAVIGIPSEQWGESVHAVVVRNGPELDEPTLLAWAREHLAGYKLPRSVSFVDEIPRNASGKILKKVLREPFWQGADRRVG